MAHMWFNLAAAGSNGDRHINNRELAADQLTPDELNEAQRLAREWDAAHPREPRNYLLEQFEEELLDALGVPR
ncbi:MAG: hypothetical protein OSB03_16970 [Vicinamibacterales bacterium]|nr:hypothetical protein [Vicinamibacterales bacterium]